MKHPPQLFHMMNAFEKGAKLKEQQNELASMLQRTNSNQNDHDQTGDSKTTSANSNNNSFNRRGSSGSTKTTTTSSGATTATKTKPTASTNTTSQGFPLPKAHPHNPLQDFHPVSSPSNSFHSASNNTTTTPSSYNSNARVPRGYRPDYTLGETARSTSHMLIDENPYSAFQYATSLHDGDYAFIKRSDGSWTYAVLGHRSLAPTASSRQLFQKTHDAHQQGPKVNHHGHHYGNASHPSNYHQKYHPHHDSYYNSSKQEKMEECMVFILNERGSTKQYKKRQFGQEIRMVSMKGLSRSCGGDGNGSVYNGGSISGSMSGSVAGSVCSGGGDSIRGGGGRRGTSHLEGNSNLERKKSMESNSGKGSGGSSPSTSSNKNTSANNGSGARRRRTVDHGGEDKSKCDEHDDKSGRRTSQVDGDEKCKKDKGKVGGDGGDESNVGDVGGGDNDSSSASGSGRERKHGVINRSKSGESSIPKLSKLRLGANKRSSAMN